jgi:hypothetical protein
MRGCPGIKKGELISPIKNPSNGSDFKLISFTLQG